MNDTVLEKHEFGAEVGRLLDLVVHSLYSDREMLVANTADATDRRWFEALTDTALSPPSEAQGPHCPGQGRPHATDRR